MGAFINTSYIANAKVVALTPISPASDYKEYCFF